MESVAARRATSRHSVVNCVLLKAFVDARYAEPELVAHANCENFNETKFKTKKTAHAAKKLYAKFKLKKIVGIFLSNIPFVRDARHL